MTWQQLLCAERLHPKKRNYTHDRSAFEVDHDRLVFSKPFRRLARKTQVHPLATNDHTHNRLTHSLEVASVGRCLGKAAFKIAQRYDNNIPATAEDFAQLVQAACLAHDVGNTPFGHAGERAIRQWMSEQTNRLYGLTDAQKNDLTLYEGNAQAFRLATRTVSEFKQAKYESTGGMALTAATLATMMKYPWGSDHETAISIGKYSVFQSDLRAFNWVIDAVGLLPIGKGFCRHPLAFLVEAADDICNSVIDIEDAIDLHIIQPKDVFHSLRVLSGLDSRSSIAQMRASSIGNMIESCLQVFDEQYPAIMQGQYQAPLVEGMRSEQLAAFNKLNEIAHNKVYPFQQNKDMEQSCFTTLSRILSKMVNTSDAHQNLELDVITIPFVEFTQAISHSTNSGYERLMCAMDFVAGMTDNYAVNLAGRLSH